MIQQYPEVLIQPERQYFKFFPLKRRMPRTENMAAVDEIFEPCVGCLRELWICFTTGDDACGTEQGCAVTDLVFG